MFKRNGGMGIKFLALYFIVALIVRASTFSSDVIAFRLVAVGIAIASPVGFLLKISVSGVIVHDVLFPTPWIKPYDVVGW